MIATVAIVRSKHCLGIVERCIGAVLRVSNPVIGTARRFLCFGVARRANRWMSLGWVTVGDSDGNGDPNIGAGSLAGRVGQDVGGGEDDTEEDHELHCD